MILYQLTNRITGKSYVGITKKGLRRRWLDHLGRARNGAARALYDAIRMDGEAVFSVIQIGEASSWETLKEMERAAIAIYATLAPSGYNLTLGGQGNLGWVPNEETRAKMTAHSKKLGLLRRGREISAETRARLSAALSGRRCSEETKQKLSRAHTGKKLSPEHRARLSIAGIGRRRSPETAAKLLAAHLGSKRSAEACARIAAGHRGRKLSIEHRAKLSAAHKGKIKSKEHQEKISEALRGRSLAPAHRAKISLMRRGEGNPTARLSESQVAEIRRRANAGERINALAAQFGVHNSSISRIVGRQQWLHVAAG